MHHGRQPQKDLDPQTEPDGGLRERLGPTRPPLGHASHSIPQSRHSIPQSRQTSKEPRRRRAALQADQSVARKQAGLAHVSPDQPPNSRHETLRSEATQQRLAAVRMEVSGVRRSWLTEDSNAPRRRSCSRRGATSATSPARRCRSRPRADWSRKVSSSGPSQCDEDQPIIPREPQRPYNPARAASG